MKGLFVTFEGPDGSGKSTQIQNLSEYLSKRGIEHIKTREPGGTEIGDKIRALLLSPEHSEMKNETEVLLYAASRAQHVREKIVPALQEGKIVLCDRFVDASVAYQAYGLQLEVHQIQEINRFGTGGLQPHRSYFLDLSPKLARQRMLNRRDLDRIELKDTEYHERVRAAFLSIYKENPKRICMLDGEKEKQELFSEIMIDFNKILSSFRREAEGEFK